MICFNLYMILRNIIYVFLSLTIKGGYFIFVIRQRARRHTFLITGIKKRIFLGVPIVAQGVKNPTSIHKDAGLIPGLTQWVKDLALPQTVA